MSKFRILSLDGGGIRGVLTAVLLQRLEEKVPGFISKIDMVAGTSTGGILALGLAYGLTPAQCQTIYTTQGREIFADSFWDNLVDFGNLRGSQYPNKNLQSVLAQYFGDKKLSDLQKRVLVSSFHLDNEAYDPRAFRTWKAKFFHNFPEEGSDVNERIVDAALRTSAAPTYFPIYQGYIDGGVVANNPSVCALAQALDSVKVVEDGAERPIRMDEIALISVGTGKNQQYISEKNADWGLAQWARHLVSILIDGTAGVAEYQSRQLLGDHYCRLDPTLREAINLDSVAKITRLIEIGSDADITEAVEWLKRNF
jgi:patatin-like phospholipase/acyl hydrolase